MNMVNVAETPYGTLTDETQRQTSQQGLSFIHKKKLKNAIIMINERRSTERSDK